jgi:hypothetical protein
MYKKYCLGTLPVYLFEMVRIWIRIKQSDSDPYKIGKPDPYQSEKKDPDPYQNGLVPQHCLIHP